MAKEKKGSGIQQAAGLIRYFDEESEDAIQISKGSVYFGSEKSVFRQDPQG